MFKTDIVSNTPRAASAQNNLPFWPTTAAPNNKVQDICQRFFQTSLSFLTQMVQPLTANDAVTFINETGQQTTIVTTDNTPTGELFTTAFKLERNIKRDQSLQQTAQQACSKGLFNRAHKIAGQILNPTLRTSVLTHIQNARLSGIGPTGSSQIKNGLLAELVTSQLLDELLTARTVSSQIKTGLPAEFVTARETQEFKQLERQPNQKASQKEKSVSQKISQILDQMELVSVTKKSGEGFRYDPGFPVIIKDLASQAQNLTRQISHPTIKKEACDRLDHILSSKIDKLCKNNCFTTAQDIARLIDNKETQTSKLRDIASKKNRAPAAEKTQQNPLTNLRTQYQPVPRNPLTAPKMSVQASAQQPSPFQARC